MVGMIPLREIVYDIRARDGTWCKYPYHNHPNGCPNFPKCLTHRIDFKLIEDKYLWYAVVEEFDLKAHSEDMKRKHPDWSEYQCRCVLYWQGGVRKRLKAKAKQACKELGEGSIILDIPEMQGINIFDTMAKVYINLERYNPSIVKKVMIVGLPKTVEGIC